MHLLLLPSFRVSSYKNIPHYDRASILELIIEPGLELQERDGASLHWHCTCLGVSHSALRRLCADINYTLLYFLDM